MLYSLELMKLPDETLLLIEKLHTGRFPVNRTENSFSCVQVEMALEQTINAEAKTRLENIMAYADVASAMNRCVVTNYMRN